MKDNKDVLYNYILHFNSYTGYWNAVTRDNHIEYLNGTLKEDDILKNKDVGILIDYIVKTGK